jgi:hypothetical protein
MVTTCVGRGSVGICQWDQGSHPYIRVPNEDPITAPSHCSTDRDCTWYTHSLTQQQKEQAYICCIQSFGTYAPAPTRENERARAKNGSYERRIIPYDLWLFLMPLHLFTQLSTCYCICSWAE